MKLRFSPLIIVLGICLIGAAGCSQSSKASSGASGSGTASEKPMAPRHFRAETNSREVILIWDMPAWADRYSFNIYRWRPDHEPKFLDTVPAGVHHYVDISAAQSRKYFYMVVTTDGGAEISDCSAQIKDVALLPSEPVETASSWITGVTPPKFPSDPEGETAWNLERLQEIKDELPWTCVTEICADCAGKGIVAVSKADGPPVITFCATCRGAGYVIRVTPK